MSPHENQEGASSTTTTNNDEAIALALAKAEQESADRELAHQLETQADNGGRMNFASLPDRVRSFGGTPAASLIDCPGQHGLNEFLVSYAQRVICDVCGERLRRDQRAYGCVACGFDVCDRCKERAGGVKIQLQPPRDPLASALPYPFASQHQLPEPPAHMCIAPCVLGNGTCVEMMVDTGAQSSVISLPLARQVGLESRIDQSQQGVASGVGKARIMGKIRNVICQLGEHAEFPLDFLVLDTTDKLLLLGLDLMRRFKCIVDLERDVLIFGGQGGVEVPLLPAEQQHYSLRNQAMRCPMM